MSSWGPSVNLAKSFRAAATLSAFRVVGFDTVTAAQGYVRLIQIPTETTHIFGISQDSATTDQAFPVASIGYARGAAGASVSSGAILTFATTTGYLIEAGLGGTFATTAFSTVGSVMPKQVGIALQTGSATDAVMEVFLEISNRRVRVA